MKSFSAFRRVVACAAVVLTTLTISYAQSPEKTNAVAAYVRVADEDAGIVRRRVVAKEIEENDFSGEMTPERIAGYEHRVLALINKMRADYGVGPLEWSDSVARIARLHSDNMASLNFFNHRGADGKMVDGRADDCGVTKWRAIGENIAYNRGFKNPLDTAVVKWLESPSHRENLLNDRWQETGIGIAVTADGTFYFTQVFLKK